MSKQLHIDNKNYVSSVAAGEAVGFSHDYLSRLCRAGSLQCRRIGRVWYIEEDSLNAFVNSSTQRQETSVESEVPEKASSLHTNTFYESAQHLEPQIPNQPTEPEPSSATLQSGASNILERSIQNIEEENTLVDTQTVFSEIQLPEADPQPTDVQTTSIVQEEHAIPREIVRRPKSTRPTQTTRRTMSFGPVVAFLLLVAVTTGGYSFARAYESPLHAVIQETVTAAKVGALYSVESIAARFSNGDSHATKKVKRQEPVVRDNLAAFAQGIHFHIQSTAMDLANAVVGTKPGFAESKPLPKTQPEPLTDASGNTWLESVASGFAKMIDGSVTNLPGRIVQYGEVPVEFLASTLSSFTQNSLAEQAPQIYEQQIGHANVQTEPTENTKPQMVEQTVINQPVIERVVEKHFTVVESGVTLEQLQQTENELRKYISSYTANQPVQPIQNFRNIALTQKIDNLGSVDITNSTFAGGSISNSSAALTTLTTTGNTTIGGDLTVTGSTTLGTLASLTLTGDLAVNGGDITSTASTLNLTVADAGTFNFTDGTNNLVTITDQGTTADVTITGDLTVSGDDITLNTNTDGAILVADGTNFNPVTTSGDVTVSNTGVMTVADDILDFTELSDTLAVDATTTFDLDTALADLNFDSNTLYIDSSANAIGIGTSTPTDSLTVTGGARFGSGPTTAPTTATSNLLSSATSFGTTTIIGSTAEFPKSGTFLMGTEIIGYTDRDSSFGTLTRGMYGTTAQTHNIGTAIVPVLQATVNNDTTARMVVLGDGRVGIGTATPSTSYTLDVSGTGRFTGLTTFDSGISINSETVTDFSGTGITVSGGALTATLGTSVDLASEVTGTLPVANGGTGATTLNNLITLGTHTTGNYLATLADAGNSFFTVTGSGSESAAVTIDVANDSLNFAQLSDALVVDATTTVDLDTNAADLNFDSNTLVIDSSANNIGIGTNTPTAKLTVSELLQVQGDATPQFPSAGAGVEIGYDSDVTTYGGGTAGAGIIQSFDRDSVNYETLYINAYDVTLATEGTSRLFVQNSGDVGIGVTDPDKRLEVFETVADAQLKLSYDATRYAQFQTNSVGDLIVDAQGGDVFLNDENLFVCTGGSCPAGTPASTGTIVAESRVGIGTSDPVANLEIVNNVQSGFDAYTDYQILLHDAGTAATSMGIGIETNTLAFNTDAEYDFYIDSAVTPEVSINNATSTFQGDIVIAGKLDVDTIDPVYTIDGVKYATYGHSTIGIKEEATAKLVLTEYSEADDLYYKRIDFDELKEGSDLWLFYQITDFGKNWENLLVTLTPVFNGSVHYTEDRASNSITIYGDQPGAVATRFIAGRYDAVEWPNLREDQGVGWPGHVINGKY